MVEGDEGESQTTAGAMELETQIGASNTVGDEAQETSMDGSEVAGRGGGRRKRLRPCRYIITVLTVDNIGRREGDTSVRGMTGTDDGRLVPGVRIHVGYCSNMK